MPYPAFTIVFFTMFVIFIPILLTNLMVGLSVDKIHKVLVFLSAMIIQNFSFDHYFTMDQFLANADPPLIAATLSTFRYKTRPCTRGWPCR